MRRQHLIFKLLVVLLTPLVVMSCGGSSGSGNNGATLSSAKAISAFSFTNLSVTSTINENAKTITLIVPHGTNVTSLAATFTTNGASVRIGSTIQVSGSTMNDFTNPVTYLVTAEDSSQASYTVTVTLSAPSSDKSITAFSFTNPSATGTINETAKTISLTVPYGSNVTALVSTFITTGVNVKINGAPQTTAVTANDFTSPVIYVVTAEDGSQAMYTVAVVFAVPSSEKALTAFSFTWPIVTGIIDENSKTISFNISDGNNVGLNMAALIATYTTTGASVTVNGAPQSSGVTANNFTSPVVYVVAAEDSTQATYTVTVTVRALANLPDTGQTTSYTTTTGEDNDYTINPPSYTDNGDGTVTDTVTSLLWQKQEDGLTRNWYDASTYCANLLLSGSGWRLPTTFELLTIIDYGRSSPAINSTYFPSAQSSFYWSSNVAYFDYARAWFVDFTDGQAWIETGKALSHYTRCVR